MCVVLLLLYEVRGIIEVFAHDVTAKYELVFDSRTESQDLVLSPLFLRALFVQGPLELPEQTGRW